MFLAGYFAGDAVPGEGPASQHQRSRMLQPSRGRFDLQPAPLRHAQLVRVHVQGTRGSGGNGVCLCVSVCVCVCFGGG